MKWSDVCLVCLAWCGGAEAQVHCSSGGDSKIWFFNYEPGSLIEYPNFRSPGGTHAGDALWKVLPSELFRRTSPGCVPTNTTVILYFDNPGPGPAVFIHAWELRYLTRNAQGHWIPDFSRTPFKAGATPETGGVSTPGYYQYRQDGTGYGIEFDAWGEPGLAFVLYPPPGQTPATFNVHRGVVSRNERYGKAPQPSFSGVRNGATGEVSLLVPPLVPQAGELMFAFGFYDPMVSVSASSSGGDMQQPWQMNTGVGAFYNDLASQGGRMRLYVEDDNLSYGDSGPIASVYALPLLSLGRGTSRYPIPFHYRLCEIAVDMNDPVCWLPVLWGWMPNFIRRDGRSNLRDAYAWTPWIDVPQSITLIDVKLHFEVLTLGITQAGPFIGTVTNSLEICLK